MSHKNAFNLKQYNHLTYKYTSFQLLGINLLPYTDLFENLALIIDKFVKKTNNR